MLLRHVYEPKFGQEDQPSETHTEDSYEFTGHPDNLAQDEYSSVIVRFRRFGRGEKPRNYEVHINWLDMKWLLREFIEAENPHAQHLKKILEMARSLDNSGWRNDREPPEFWENLLVD